MKLPPLLFIIFLILLLSLVAWNEIVPTKREKLKLANLDWQEAEKLLITEKSRAPFPPGTTQAQKGKSRFETFEGHWKATVIINGKSYQISVEPENQEKFESAHQDGHIELTYKLKRFGTIKVLEVH